MSVNTNFMASLMKIPYFAQLADSNGEQWLTDIFNTLETSNYDFSQFQAANSADADSEDASPIGTDSTSIPVDLHSSDAAPTVEATAAAAAAADDSGSDPNSETV